MAGEGLEKRGAAAGGKSELRSVPRTCGGAQPPLIGALCKAAVKSIIDPFNWPNVAAAAATHLIEVVVCLDHHGAGLRALGAAPGAAWGGCAAPWLLLAAAV